MSRTPASGTYPSPYPTGTHPSATSPYNHSDSERSFCIELYHDSTDHFREVNEQTGCSLRLAVHNNFKWPEGHTITVCFLTGSPYLQRKVMDIAQEWTHHANIKFHLVQGRNAEIRIKFTGSGGPSYSWIGTDNSSVPSNQETMGLGIVDSTNEHDLRATVLHEFGHALGCVHEHMQPNFRFKWRDQVVIDAHKGRWTEKMVRENILNRYTHQQVQASSFDPDSVMIYYISPQWTEERFGTHRSSKLSHKDKEFISKMYPFPKKSHHPHRSLTVP
ncbi:hypothetical protein BJV74DRAFT_298723 [Russula compacta]|nr:hypothetical protein BJV74DRAFT_298723 [Russula compacta]